MKTDNCLTLLTFCASSKADSGIFICKVRETNSLSALFAENATCNNNKGFFAQPKTRNSVDFTSAEESVEDLAAEVIDADCKVKHFDCIAIYPGPEDSRS